MSVLIQRSLSGGEISPSLAARADTVKYATGLRTMRNAWTRSDGGSQNRPGTEFIAEIADSESAGRMIPFEFNDEQTYILELTDLVLRVYKEGVYQTEIQSPYEEADLMKIRFAQSADVMTFSCEGYEVYELAREADAVWSLVAAPLGARYAIGLAYGVALAAGGAGTATNRYVVTGVFDDGSETPPLVLGTAYYEMIGVIHYTPENTILSSDGNTDIVAGDLIYVTGISDGPKELNGRYFTVVQKTIHANTDSIYINLGNEDLEDWVAGGYICRACVSDITAVNPPTTANPDVLSAVGASTLYQIHSDNNTMGTTKAMNIYMESNGAYGFIGTTASGTFRNTGITPDLSINPPDLKAFFDTTVETPSVCALLQQRRVFANFPTNTEQVVASNTGLYSRFAKLNPLVDSDAVVFTMAGKKVAAVKHIVDAGQMILFASTGEFAALGNASGFITPGEVNLKQQSAFGCNDLAPIIIDGSAIFVQARGSFIRNLQFDQNSNGFRGSDLTVFAKHLVEDNTIVDWAYQLNPHSIVWIVRDDGVLLSMTYVKEQEILAFGRHDFENAFVENVCVVPEGNEDKLYLIIRRTVNGESKRYLERMNARYVDSEAIEDSVFMDASLSYDGWHTGETTMTLSGGTLWTYDESIVLTASASFFDADEVGNEIHLVGEDDTILRCRIIEYVSPTIVNVHPHKTVPAAMRLVGIPEWARAVDQVSGLDHIENEDVSVFADGFVVASPNNTRFAIRTVTDGVLTLDKCYAVIHVGLPITSDIELLDLDRGGADPGIADKHKNVSAVTVYLEKSRGGYFGPSNPDTNIKNEDENALFGLIEMKPRSIEGYDDPAALKSGPFEIAILPEWNSNGRVFIRQVDPVPMSILAVAPSGMFPFGGG